eukprot:scaffold104276_cov75-Phaeocystis_antarctica.AAC.9
MVNTIFTVLLVAREYSWVLACVKVEFGPLQPARVAGRVADGLGVTAGHRHLRHRRVSCPTVAAVVLEGKRRRVDVDTHGVPCVALVAAQAPHRLPCSVGQAELAHVGAVHVVVKGHCADALAIGGARGAVVGERELQSRVDCWPVAHAVHEVVGDAVHLFARQATRPHDHLGDRKVRLLVAVVPSVDEQRHTTSAARSGANVDPVDQLELRACIGSAHDHP